MSNEPPPLPNPPKSPRSTAGQTPSQWKRTPLIPHFWIWFVGVPGLILFLILASGLVKHFFIPTGAMKPNLPPGTHLIAEKLSLWFSPPGRGEVLVFSTDNIKMINRNNPGARTQYFIMRTAGLPGDKLEVQDGNLLVNGEPFAILSKDNGEPLTYQPAGSLKEGESLTVPEDSYFMMGDNSGNSFDSRLWGPLPKENIKYRYLFTIFYRANYEKNKEEQRRKQMERLRDRS